MTNLPAPFLLVAKGDDEVAEEHDDGVGDKRDETHFWFTNTTVAESELHGNPVREIPVGKETYQRSHQHCKVHEADRLAGEFVGRCGKNLRLSEIEREKTTGGPGDNEG